MQQLILFRHARAEKFARNGDDHDRKATKDGQSEALSVTEALIEAGACPDIVLLSSARRCVDTWETIKAYFPDALVQSCPELYLASQKEILQLARASGGQSVMIIGHNPGLASLVQDLSAHGNPRRFEEAVRFPPAAAALFSHAPDSDGLSPVGLFLP